MEFAILGEQDHDAAGVERLVHVTRGGKENIVEIGGAGEFAGQFIKRLRRLCAHLRAAGLIARSARQQSREYRDDEEDHQREEFLRLGDGYFVARIDEKEVVGEKGK